MGKDFWIKDVNSMKVETEKMPDTLESIKDMYDDATADERDKFLFKALLKLSVDLKSGIDEVNINVRAMQKACECRKKSCAAEFVTKNQSRIFGIMVAIFAAGVGIGSGTIAWFELIKMAKP